jgi:hypothetical protein
VTGLTGAALTEAVSTTVSSTGLALLVAALLIRCLYVRWHKTRAIYVLADNRHRLRWHTRSDVHEEPWPHPPVPIPAPGTEVTVYYHYRHPERWSLSAPYRHTWILLGAGVTLFTIGTLLPLALPWS